MKVIDPGHVYELDVIDGNGVDLLIFVKREGVNYPGNIGHYSGTNMQEVLRALIDRLRYVNNQIHDNRNLLVIKNLQTSIFLLECRAAVRHDRPINFKPEDIELLPVCPKCGHIGHVCKT